MAFQISITDDYRIIIASNDRGDWSMTDVAGGFVAEGFGGEDIVTLQWSSMQGGNASLHVTHLCVDSPITFAHAELDRDRGDVGVLFQIGAGQLGDFARDAGR